MGLSDIRKSCHLSQRELAMMSGVNYRSLQDYEQGHKKLSSASGDVLLRLSTVLGCTVEELITCDYPDGAPVLPQNQLTLQQIQSESFYCAAYKTAGRWICCRNTISILFYYRGEQITIPFHAIFTEKMLPWLKEAAVLKMEIKLDELTWLEGVDAI